MLSRVNPLSARPEVLLPRRSYLFVVSNKKAKMPRRGYPIWNYTSIVIKGSTYGAVTFLR
jgi:hypothetical protein